MDEMNSYAILSDIFPNKSREVIENIICIVEESKEYYNSFEEKLEIMINLLTESGCNDSINAGINTPGNQSIEDELLDEAAGFNINGASDMISETLNRLLEILPDADPSYLERNVQELAFNETKLEDFITHHIEKKDYPTFDDYMKKKNEESEMDKYLVHFRLYLFLLEFPDPLKHFANPNRKHAFSNYEDHDSFDLEKEFVLKCLYNQFTYLRETDINKVFKICNNNIIKTYNRLKNIPPAFKIPRNKTKLPEGRINNIPLLQEIAFIQHEKEISTMEKEKVLNFQRAKQLGFLESCRCCCTDDLIPEDCFLCRNGCKFCKDCIRTAAEIAYAEGKTEFVCLADCGSDYSLSTLQMVLNPKIFINLCHRIQMQEVNSAGIEGIEYCPLCTNFAMIPEPNDKIFHCDNCNKDSCRECKHEAHLPLKCNEIEYDEDVQMRTYIENKMTEALLRKCYNCQKTFIKNTGCNKISCSCGARMCYLCGAQIIDYSHFSNNGHGCSLFTNDEQIHFENVMQGANTAKAELGVDTNPERLKFDPTKGFNSV